MYMLDRLQSLKTDIYQIAQKYRAGKIYVFGSCARREETQESDVDFIVDFDDQASLFDHAGLELDLADLLECSVDVVSMKALKRDSFEQQVRKEMVLL